MRQRTEARREHVAHVDPDARQDAWRRLARPDRFWLTLRLLEPTLLVSLLVAGTCCLLVGVAQSRDMITAAIDEGGAAGWLLFASATFLALMIWYTTRALLYVSFGRFVPQIDENGEPVWEWRARVPPELARYARWRLLWPRILGALPVAALAIAFLLAGRPAAALFTAAIVAALSWLAIRRRRWFALEAFPELTPDLPRDTRRLAAVAFVVNALFFLGFLVFQVELPRQVGTGAILFIALSGWIVLANLFVAYPAYKYRFLTVLPIGAVALVAWLFPVDNHGIRAVDGMEEARASASLESRAEIEERFEDWLEVRRRGPGDALPVFVVATEGGGIRAAFWTARVLAEIETSHPGFACHTFAISGVSGGSVGAVVYASLLADAHEAGVWSCTRRTGAPLELARRVEDILEQDFLAPVAAGLLTADLAQRLVPFPWFDDRATYLERAFEHAYESATGSDRLARDFLALWAGARALAVPALFLNATWVQTGGRAAISNLRWSEVDHPLACADRGSFLSLENVLDRLGRTLPASAAAHGGARFPLVSPAGSVRDARSDPRREAALQGQIVDGGYFENSGALTASEIVRRLRPLCETCRFHPVLISNSPGHPGNVARPASPDACEDALAPQPPPAPERELWVPIEAFMNTREARGLRAELELAQATPEGSEIELRFVSGGGASDPPLGWMLNQPSRENLTEEARALVSSVAPTLAAALR